MSVPDRSAQHDAIGPLARASTRRAARRAPGVLRWLIALPILGCQQLANPAAQAELQQSMYDLQDLLAEMREATATLQWQVDSLQGVVARQDTTVRQMANQLGMPMP